MGETIDLKDADSHTNRGINKLQTLRQFDSAITDFDKAILINPNFALAYFYRGIAKDAIHMTRKSIIDFTLAINLNPKFSQAYINRGISKNSLGQHLAAIVDYTRAIDLNPHFAEAFYSRGLAKRALQQYLAAISDYSQAIRFNPTHAQAYNNRGNAKSLLFQHESAILDFNQAIRLYPKLGIAYINRGSSKESLGQFKAAIEDYSIAININPQYAEAHIYRGNVYQKINLRNEAIVDYCMAIPNSLNLLAKKQHHIKTSRLLKFREVNTRNLSSIQNREIWFAHPDTFVDTQDGKYLSQLFPEHDSVKQIVSSMLIYSCFGLPLESEDLHEDISINNENIMWAQYGAGSKGICLHYQYSPEIAQQNTQFSFDKITYVNDINLDENISLYDTLQHGFFTKHTDFHFENECRFITVSRDNKLKGQIVTEADLGLNLVAVDFGVECPQDDKQKVFNAVSARDDGKPVLFYELKNAAAGTFKFKRTRLLR